jgi:hypothetical protein
VAAAEAYAARFKAATDHAMGVDSTDEAYLTVSENINSFFDQLLYEVREARNRRSPPSP